LLKNFAESEQESYAINPMNGAQIASKINAKMMNQTQKKVLVSISKNNIIAIK